MNKRRAVVDDLVEQYGEYCSTFTFKLQKGIDGEEIHKEGFINCFWERKNKLVYLHVDKCGSTSITKIFLVWINYHGQKIQINWQNIL